MTDTGSVAWPGGRADRDLGAEVGERALHPAPREGRGRDALSAAAALTLEVSEWTRRRTQANHTGTHLLHAALRKVLGESVRQMGSLVAPDRLRFDYAATRPTTAAEILEVERLVNEAILRDAPVSKEVTSMDEARAKGAMMFFGEKYGERVRVVDVPGRLDGALRRLPRRPDRGDRRLQGDLRSRTRGRGAAHRGDHGARGRGTPDARRADSRRALRGGPGAARGPPRQAA